MTPVVPDVAAKVAADRFTVAVGTPLDIPISVTRTGGFTGEVVPFAESLPDGVTATPAPLPAKPDPNTVVLRLTATKVWSGSIRAGVAKKGDDTFRRTAVAAVPEFDRTTADVWLTVKPAAEKK